jgi:hypothetical protein
MYIICVHVRVTCTYVRVCEYVCVFVRASAACVFHVRMLAYMYIHLSELFTHGWMHGYWYVLTCACFIFINKHGMHVFIYACKCVVCTSFFQGWVEIMSHLHVCIYVRVYVCMYEPCASMSVFLCQIHVLSAFEYAYMYEKLVCMQNWCVHVCMTYDMPVYMFVCMFLYTCQ